MTAVVDLDGVTVVEAGVAALRGVAWRLERGEHAVVLGPNGSGKTTLVRLLAGYRAPSRGRAEILGGRYGATDLRALRRRVGVVSAGLGPLLHRRARAVDLVAAAHAGATRPTPRHVADLEVLERAHAALRRAGVAELAARRAETLSQGEWKRVQIARALVTEPELLLLDEAFAGLDLGGREALLRDLDRLLTGAAPTVVLATHHLEEIPRGVRRATLLRRGRVAVDGPPTDVLTSARISAVFGVEVVVRRRHGRWSAVAAADPGAAGE